MLRTSLHAARRGRQAHSHVRCMTLAAAPADDVSILSKLFSRSTMPSVPLDMPWPSTIEFTGQGATLVKPEIKTTTLENGLRVVSTDSGSPIASVAAFVDAGSRYEHQQNSGISHFLESIAFKSTESRSDFRLVREMLDVGANVVCSTSREHTVYAADALRAYVPNILHTLADVIQNPAFNDIELNDARAQYMDAAAEREGQANVQIMEAIHAAAYHNNTLGLPLYADAEAVASFDAQALQAHVSTFFTPKRMVISGVGVDHDDFVSQVSSEFATLSTTETPVMEKANYTGGDVRLQRNTEQLSHVAIAFESASWHSTDLVPMCVLQMMMGGGGSFSAGGPGKGMYSRLYQNVLNQNSWVESATCFNSIFSDSSIFGMYGMSAPQQASHLVGVLSEECLRMAGPVDSTELSRAKNQLIASVHMSLEHRSEQLEDQGRQLITYGTIQSAAEIRQKIEAVTDSDINRVASAMLKTPPSIAVVGKAQNVPRYEDIAKHFG